MREISIKNDSILIGSNIKRIREQQNMKPKDLVRLVNLEGADLNVFSLSKIEANSQHIKATQFRAIAKVLRVEYEELLKTVGELWHIGINIQKSNIIFWIFLIPNPFWTIHKFFWIVQNGIKSFFWKSVYRFGCGFFQMFFFISPAFCSEDRRKYSLFIINSSYSYSGDLWNFTFFLCKQNKNMTWKFRHSPFSIDFLLKFAT